MSKTHFFALSLTILLILLLAGVVRAGSSDNFAINWQVLSGGGAPAATGNVTLNGSLGQTAIGPSTGDNLSLGAGYWYGSNLLSIAPGNEPVYLPIILRSS